VDKRRIAVIEDEETIAASLAARLRSEGFGPTSSSST
jgi:DNA-binding response OmpR family regulator